jgi:hypothetical protein
MWHRSEPQLQILLVDVRGRRLAVLLHRMQFHYGLNLL